MTQDRAIGLLAAVVGVIFVWSGVHPTDRYTWVLEVSPVVVGIPLLAATRRRFPLTTLVYVLIAIHAAQSWAVIARPAWRAKRPASCGAPWRS